jgi:hypothetical protein
MRSELSFFTIPALTEKELLADDNIRARTKDVSDTTTAADSLTTVADSLLR